MWMSGGVQMLWRATAASPWAVCFQNVIRSASTVFALSSGQGKCGVALVRVTGEKAGEALTRMTKPSTLPPPRTACLRAIVHPHSGETLDRGLVLWFPGPHSFTGEDSCELHIHGGPAVIVAVLTALGKIPGYQPAQPGDFTKRAFYNGKLDLTSVEGLGDLIHAETEAQRKQALQQMEGALAHLYTSWRQMLLECRAYLEAFIDFSEDDNIEESVIQEVESKVRQLIGHMELHLSDDRRGERLRCGLQLAILGRPNVGKSSFLNVITQRPTAIVSPIPGTTRDVVETALDLGGYPVIISDTAGLRQTADVVEEEGVRRALARARNADMALLVLEASELRHKVKEAEFVWSTFLSHYLKDIGIYEAHDTECASESLLWHKDNNYVVLVNKSDLIENEDEKQLLANTIGKDCVLLSVKTCDGLDVAQQKIKEHCARLCAIGTAENPTLTAARHRTHISNSLVELKKILGSSLIRSNTENFEKVLENGKIVDTGLMKDETDDDLPNLLHSEETLVEAAYQLQQAANSLGYVTGHITSEDVLDHIFSAFCIGK